MRITSTHNTAIQYVRSLERAAVRHVEGVFVAEGVRLVREAVATGQSAALALYDPDVLAGSGAGTELLRALPSWADRSYEVSAQAMARASQTETSSGVLAVIRRPSPEPFAPQDSVFGVVLDRLNDPGNAGAILRTADALGADYVATLPGSVDLFSPKVVRAGMGAHFRLPLYPQLSWDDIMREGRCIAVAAASRGDESLDGFKWPQSTALVIGNEAHGLSKEVDVSVSRRVHIPMRVGVESLNASVAAAILMYAALGPGL